MKKMALLIIFLFSVISMAYADAQQDQKISFTDNAVTVKSNTANTGNKS